MKNSTNSPPDPGENGPQPHAGGPFPQQSPCQQGKITAHADVSPANLKAAHQPHPDHSRQKQQVRQRGMLGPQGPQKAVEQPQGSPQQQAAEKTVGGGIRGHRNSRPQKLCRGSS